MSDCAKVEDRLEAMATRLERVERVNRLMKVWGSIAIAVLVAAGPFASNVMAKRTKEPKAVTASAFNLESDGVVVASLGIFNGQPTLVFLDNSGKPVMRVGIDGAATIPTGHPVGITVFDGNADIPGGTGVTRATFGVTPSGSAKGEGMSTFDATAVQRSFAGSNGTFSGAFFYDPAGTIRSGVQYNPSTNFTGVFSSSETGVTLSASGSYIAADSGIGIQEDESFMDLFDTTGAIRLGEFQSTTNQGGVIYNPGSTTIDGDWGNP
jgi:hypothetical protein